MWEENGSRRNSSHRPSDEEKAGAHINTALDHVVFAPIGSWLSHQALVQERYRYREGAAAVLLGGGQDDVIRCGSREGMT